MDKLKNNPLVPSFLLITIIPMLAYLPLIPFLGFYSEDLFFGYIGHFYGPEGLIRSLSIDRPFQGYLLSFIYNLLGDNVLFWHLFTFLMRLFGGYVLFFLLIKLWPNKLSVVTTITLLFLVYPGFLRQTLPLGYGAWVITLTLWILSLVFTVYAAKSRSKFKLIVLTMFALILQMVSFLQLEFFIGLETFRFLLITYIFKNEISIRAIKRTFIYWIPYILSLAIFVFWRIVVFKSARDITDISWVAQTYYQNPLWIAKIPIEIIHSFIQTVILPFFIPIIIRVPRIPLEGTLISLFIGVITAVILYLYFNTMEKSKYDEGLKNLINTKKFGKEISIIGLVSILSALIPIIISGRFVRLFDVFDRYTITSIIAVAFIITGFLFYKFSPKLRKIILISLISISVTAHTMNGYLFSVNWDQQKNIWWQLYWRAPKIENNSMMIFDFPPLIKDTPFNKIVNRVQWYRIYWVDYQIWAIGNLFFNYDALPQTHFRGDYLSGNGIIQKIKDKTFETFIDYTIPYDRDFNNTIIVTAPNDISCLWVLDKNLHEFPSHANELLKSSLVYSDADKLVQAGSPVTPPKQIFGDEPPHEWCYYFQKASLARQFKDWDQLSRLKKEVIQKNLEPQDPNEWLPFEKDLR